MAPAEDVLARLRKWLATNPKGADRVLARALEDDPSHAPIVIALLADPEPFVREAAMKALSHLARVDPNALLPFVPDVMENLTLGAAREAKRGAEPRERPAPFTAAPGIARARPSKPVSLDAFPSARVAAVREAPAILHASLAEMLATLLALGWTPDVARAADPFKGWKVLSIESMEDFLEGAVHLLEMVHRNDEHARPWTGEEVQEILLKRVLPTVAPLRVIHQFPDELLLEVGPPLPLPPAGVDPTSWPAVVEPFVLLLGRFVHPAFEFKREEDAPRPGGSVRFLAVTRDAPIAAAPEEAPVPGTKRPPEAS